MQIEMRPIQTITPYARNPRLNDAAVDAVARSIKEFGFRQPIVVDERSVVIVGHTRLKAASRLGLTEVPVHVAAGLTEEQAKAYRIADNQTATIAEWDEARLIAELADLQSRAFDLSLTGFDADELLRLTAPPESEGITDPDQVPAPPEAPVTQPGDLWSLGRHRLICGDATRSDDMSRLMNGRTADMLLTDPPYGVAYVGKTADRMTIDNDDLDDEPYRRFLAATVGNAVTHLRPGGAFYVWHADSRGLVVRRACQEAGLTIRQCLVWAKNAMVLGRQDYQWRHEPCLYGWRDGAAHLWFGERDKTTVLEFDRPSRSGDHPTTKPVELLEHLIGNSCPRGGLILDPFGGSGSTMIAAEKTGNASCLMELSPAYCDVIVKRWEEFTGGKAVRESDGVESGVSRAA